MLVLLAPDKFRGTLDAPSAARAMALGVKRAWPDANIVELPLADGGDGTLDVLLRASSGEVVRTMSLDPLGRAIETRWARFGSSLGVVEMASASGMARLGHDEYDPLRAGSLGTGRLMNESLKSVDRCIVAVGGSASTDGGTGAATAWGWRFLDRTGNDLPPGGGHLPSLAAIEPGERLEGRIVGACDVGAPLLGPQGAARAFGPQKGASPDDVARLEDGLERLVELLERDLDISVEALEHAGAGGGMGAGLAAFADADLVRGFDLVAEWTGLEALISDADVVITGEGRLDENSLLGKVPGEVAARARRNGSRCIAVAGEVQLLPESSPFDDSISLSQRFGRERALDDTAAALTEAVAAALRGS